MSITVIGYDGSALSGDAGAALDASTLVVGGRRQLDAVGLPAGARTVVLGPLATALEALAAHDAPAVVLASGDPGFFGIVRALSEHGLELARILPARSSVSAAFSRAAVTWDDALVVSAHGTGDGRELRRAANVCRAHPKVAVLTGPTGGVSRLASELLPASHAARVDRTFVVAQRLGEPDEAVERVTLEQAAGREDWAEPNVVLCLAADRPSAAKRWLAGWSGPTGIWALPENDFEHRDAQITKAEIRALVLARLAPKPGDLVWDLGAGSGSVGVECARLGAAAVAVEQDAESCARIAANAAAHGVDVPVVHGRAPEALNGLPAPDSVFIGGGGLDVVRAALLHGPRRMVVSLAAVERVGQVVALFEADGRSAEGVLLQSSRLTALPGPVHRFAAQNPVFVLWGARP